MGRWTGHRGDTEVSGGDEGGVHPGARRARDRTPPRGDDAASPDPLLFPGRDGVLHLQPSTLHRDWRMTRDAAGRPDLRVHDFATPARRWRRVRVRRLQSHSSGSATARSLLR